MDSPRPSSETSTLAEQDQPLLEELSISSPNSLKPSPASHPRTNNHVFRIRLVIGILNFLAIPIPVFGAPDTLMPLLPMAYCTTFLAFPAIVILLNNSDTSRKCGQGNGKGDKNIELGSRRSAILVEDPVTGEERWMLEPKKEVKTMGRKHVLGIDIYCMVVFLVSIILSLVFGTDSPITLGGVVAVRSVTVLLISSVMVAGEPGEVKSVDDLESKVAPQFCSRTG